MKRAAMVVFTIAILVLVGAFSAPVLQDSSCYAATYSSGAKVASGSGGTAGDGTINTGECGGGSGGGENQGDADGLSGLKVPDGRRASGADPARIWVVVELWAKFMVWVR